MKTLLKVLLLIIFFPTFTFAVSSYWDTMTWDQDNWEDSVGDVNGDAVVDLKDAVMALQVLSGITPQDTIFSAADIDGDKKIGMAEAIYAIQKAAGINIKSE
jgi:hypothetical protein